MRKLKAMLLILLSDRFICFTDNPKQWSLLQNNMTVSGAKQVAKEIELFVQEDMVLYEAKQILNREQ